MKTQIELINELLSQHGINTIEKLEDFENLPSSSKTNLKGLKPNQFSELRITSGSTGEPCYIFYSKESQEKFIQRTIKSIKESNVNEEDLALNLFAYGNYVPGSMYERACYQMNIPVIPLGAPNTYHPKKMIEVIKSLKPTVWFSVPSYALSLLDILSKISPELYPKKIIVAGEVLQQSYVNKFKEYGVTLINHFGLTECPAIGYSRDNPFIFQVIDEGILIQAKDTDEGSELIVTDLFNYSTPIIKYITKDLIKIHSGTKDKVESFEILKRSDNLIKLQGILTSKNEIMNKISKFSEEYYIILKIEDSRDFVEIHLPKNVEKFNESILEELSFIRAKKELIFEEKFEIPKTSSFKNCYFKDDRK